MTVLTPLLAAVIAVVVIAWLLRSGKSAIALDLPNERSLHTRPVPRIGGIGIVLGALVPLGFSGVPGIVAGLAAGLAGMSFVDDRRGLPISVRFGAHLVAAVVVIPALAPALPVWSWLLVAPAIVWMTNLYNFMDGSDGLAGGMAIFGFGAYAAAAAAAGDASLAVAGAGVAAASAGFLVFNHHPARVFMGDVGSIPLGFLAAALGLLGWSRDLWPAWFPVVVFAPFVVDATVTLLRRMARGERFWEAHRSHYYQRLVRLGWGHRRTAYAEYGLMAFVALAAVLAARQSPALQGAAVALVAAVLAVLAVSVDRAWAVHLREGAGA